jgi:hypothetical protein
MHLFFLVYHLLRFDLILQFLISRIRKFSSTLIQKLDLLEKKFIFNHEKGKYFKIKIETKINENRDLSSYNSIKKKETLY